MAAIFQGIFFLLLGIALLMYDYRAWKTGIIRSGFPKRGGNKFDIDDSVHEKSTEPIPYWITFVIFAVAGIWVTSFSIRLLTGHTDPISLAIIWYK